MILRHRREVSSTLTLSMDVTRFRRFWAIEHHIFSAIWGKEHPQHNGFLAVIELDVPDGSTNNALPPPVPTKDKLFYGDYRLAALYDWIHNHCPKPSIYKGTIGPKPEILRCEQLAGKLREKYGPQATVITQMPVYSFIEKSPPKIDIYLFTGTQLTLFECKLHVSQEKDVFQLIDIAVIVFAML